MTSNCKLRLQIVLMITCSGLFNAAAQEVQSVELPKTAEVESQEVSISTEDQAQYGVPIDDQAIQELLEQLAPAELDPNSAKALAAKQKLNLTPELLMAFRRLLAQKEVALNQPIKEIELRVDSEKIELSATQKPILIAVRQNYDTFVEFYDLAGNPWPVEAFVSVGNEKMFKANRLSSSVVTTNGEGTTAPETKVSEKSHIVRVTAASGFGDTTMTVQLQGQTETVNFRLIHNQLANVVDYKRVFTVPAINREAAEREYAKSDEELVDKRHEEFMQASHESFSPYFTGDVPTGAMVIPVIEGDAEAWMYKGNLYVRSRNEILTYPSNQMGVQSQSGMYVHKMKPYPRVTYFADSSPKTILLDDEALMSAYEYQKSQLEQEEQAVEFLKVGG